MTRKQAHQVLQNYYRVSGLSGIEEFLVREELKDEAEDIFLFEEKLEFEEELERSRDYEPVIPQVYGENINNVRGGRY